MLLLYDISLQAAALVPSLAMMLKLLPWYCLVFVHSLHCLCYCRYFTVPFMMVLMHMKPPTALQATLTAAMFAAVNLFVIYMFLFRPFIWPDGSTARFLF
jgi:hypothetical protein